jgi:cation:H+ antiporter
VSSGATLASSVGIPASIIGLLLIAFGTSAPEFTSGITAAIKKGEGLAFGTTLGAIVLHFFFAAGLAALIHPVIFDFAPFRLPLVILFGTIATFTAYVNIRKQSDRYLGAILISIYLLFLALNLSGIVTTEVHFP